MAQQARTLVHVSNLYYYELQGRLAERLAGLIGPGRCFFCNSGAEANEGLFKLARKFGHAEGRYEIMTDIRFLPWADPGRHFRHRPGKGEERIRTDGGRFQARCRSTISRPCGAPSLPQTAAILIEPIQGESGVTPATPEYLFGLRRLCDERNLLLLFDEVQAGHFRTGRFHSWQSIVEQASGLPRTRDACATFPDAVSMAKSLGNGFPIGGFWVAEKYADVLGPGSHASTFGGTPLACAVALKVLDIMERDRLAQNAKEIGDFLLGELRNLQSKFPAVIRAVRGMGLMIGIELVADAPAFQSRENKSAASQFVSLLHEKGVLTVPAGTAVVRLLPPLNLSRAEAEEGLKAIEAVAQALGR